MRLWLNITSNDLFWKKRKTKQLHFEQILNINLLYKNFRGIVPPDVYGIDVASRVGPVDSTVILGCPGMFYVNMLNKGSFQAL